MLRLPNPFGRKRLSRREKALRASALAVPTQDIGHVRSAATRATINGLRAAVSDVDRARFDLRMAHAREAVR